MVETDSSALSESEDILVIAGCGRRERVEHSPISSPPLTSDQPPPWQLVAGWWYNQHQRGLPAQIDDITTLLDGLFPHVYDVHRLSCIDVEAPRQLGDCVHTWAARTARAHRHAVVRGWINRLTMTLDGIAGTSAANSECTHVVVVDSWPLTADDAESLAYLTQLELVCGPFAVDSGYYEPHHVAVLRVPEWAAAPVGELPRPMRSEPKPMSHINRSYWPAAPGYPSSKPSSPAGTNHHRASSRREISCTSRQAAARAQTTESWRRATAALRRS
jgi:hypothetical protein